MAERYFCNNIKAMKVMNGNIYTIFRINYSESEKQRVTRLSFDVNTNNSQKICLIWLPD
jgi:hypothetical protein